jgi:hypothetical protein
MTTIYNPYKEHSWYYQGPPPNTEDYQITLTYLKRRLHHDRSMGTTTKRKNQSI